MATETFFKEIIIDDEAADRLIMELEKQHTPYTPKRDMSEILKEGEEWLREYRLKKLSAQKKKQTL